MRGSILDYEAKQIKNAGREEGFKESFKEGFEEGRMNTVISLVKDGLLSLKDAATYVNLSETALQQKMKAI